MEEIGSASDSPEVPMHTRRRLKMLHYFWDPRFGRKAMGSNLEIETFQN
jgi:hypothetical protein